MAIQIDRKSSRVSIFEPHTRSTFETNFTAAASSRKPITTLIDTIQPPAFGSDESSPGKSARKKNGSANAAEYPSMPTSGHIQSPCAVETRSAPTSGTVHVNEVSVNVTPIRSVPMNPPDPDIFESGVNTELGMTIS